jgi:hypothetical protein
MLLHPFEFLSVLVRTIWARSFGYLLDWIAIYGFAYWPVPALVYPLSMAALISSFFVKANNDIVKRSTRRGLLIAFILSYIATFVIMYVTFNPIGSEKIDSVQGRYFMTVMPLLFLALACLPAFNHIHVSAWFPSILGGTALLLYAGGMYLSYYVPCGSQYYRTDLCYQPNYKNWAPADLYSPPITDQLTLQQEIVPECSGLTELRVWIDARAADPDASTQFVLTDMQQKKDVISVSVLNAEFPSGAWHPLNFEPDWESNGKFYLLTIGMNQNDATGPRIAYSLRQEYPAGKLYENDEPIQRDLIFQTGCIAGWNKLRLTGSP